MKFWGVSSRTPMDALKEYAYFMAHSPASAPAVLTWDMPIYEVREIATRLRQEIEQGVAARRAKDAAAAELKTGVAKFEASSVTKLETSVTMLAASVDNLDRAVAQRLGVAPAGRVSASPVEVD
jgi:hypothetical protein